jgi:hypothetical protein
MAAGLELDFLRHVIGDANHAPGEIPPAFSNRDFAILPSVQGVDAAPIRHGWVHTTKDW